MLELINYLKSSHAFVASYYIFILLYLHLVTEKINVCMKQHI